MAAVPKLILCPADQHGKAKNAPVFDAPIDILPPSRYR